MKRKTVFDFTLFLISSLSLITEPAFSYEKIYYGDYFRELEVHSVQNSLFQQLDTSSSTLIANDHGGGRGDRHGSRDALPSLERRLDELREHRGKATGRDRTKIDQKIKNIQREIDKAKTGVEHGKRERGQQRFEPPEMPELADTL